MYQKNLFCIIVLFLLVTIGVWGENGSLESVLKSAYASPDSSDYYFQKAYRMLRTNKDRANYQFCKNAKAFDTGRFDTAIHYGKLALKAFTALRDTTKMLFVYSNLGKSYSATGNYEEAVKMLLRGASMAEKQKNYLWVSRFYINTALSYHDYEDFARGIKYGKLALEELSKTAEPDYFLKALALNTIGINFDDWNKPDSALSYHYRILGLRTHIDSLKIAFTYNNIGNTLLKTKRYRQAESWVKRAMKINELNRGSSMPQSYYYEKATHFTNLGVIAFNLNRNAEAERYIDSAKVYVIKSVSTEKLRDYYQLQFMYNKHIGNYRQAFVYQERYFGLRDSIFEDRKAKRIAELEMKYHTEKKERDLALIQAEYALQKVAVQKRNIFITGLAVLIILIAVFLIFIIRQQKIRIRQQAEEYKLRFEIQQMEALNKLQSQRLEISRDLHDNIGSQLTFIISSISNIIFKHKNENHDLLDQLGRTRQFANDTITELRDTIWAIGADTFSFMDLRERLLNFIGKQESTGSELKVLLEIEDRLNYIELSSLAGVNIYRIVQEAANNAMKYSGATTLRAVFSTGSDHLLISIVDDGKGFDTHTVKQGNGLNNMMKRAQILNGDFTIDASSGNGTKLYINIPLNSLSLKHI
jgi:signal transduction histidine kinase